MRSSRDSDWSARRQCPAAGRGKNDRPDSAASLIFEDHQRNAERRRAALANDLDAQRGAFKQRLEERKSKGKRSKSKDPGAKRRD